MTNRLVCCLIYTLLLTHSYHAFAAVPVGVDATINSYSPSLEVSCSGCNSPLVANLHAQKWPVQRSFGPRQSVLATHLC